MDEITWSDGSKYERSKKEDNPENKTTDENKLSQKLYMTPPLISANTLIIR